MPNKHLYPENVAHNFLLMIYIFRDENALKLNNSYCQKLFEEGVLHITNKNKRIFDPNCEENINIFVRLSKVRNEIGDLSVDYDDDYLNENNKEPPLSEVVRKSGFVDMPNVMISDDSMREMI